MNGVGVSPISGQNERAVSAGEGARCNRPSGDTIRPLHIVSQHISGQGQLAFRAGADVAVVDRFGHIVSNVDVQRIGGRIAIGVAGNHGEVLAQAVGAIAGRMGFVGHQRVGVTDHAGRRVIARDAQGVAQGRGNRLRETGGHTAHHHVDAAHVQARQAIGGRHAEGAALGQGRRIAIGTLGQIGFVDGQFTTGHVQAAEGHDVVYRWHDHGWGVVVLLNIGVVPFFREFRNAAKPCGREADTRIDAPAHFFQQYKTVTAAQGTARGTRRARTGCGGFAGLGRVSAGRNGFLQLLHIGELRFARRHGLRGIHVGRLMREQLGGHLQAAVAPKGQFLAILQVHRHRAFGPGDQLIAGKQPVALDQRASSTVGRNREHLTNNLTDDSDERSHVHLLRCQPLSAPSCAKNVLMAKAGSPGGSSTGARVYRSKPRPWRRSRQACRSRAICPARGKTLCNQWHRVPLEEQPPCERCVTVLNHSSDKKPSLKNRPTSLPSSTSPPYVAKWMELSSNPLQAP